MLAHGVDLDDHSNLFVKNNTENNCNGARSNRRTVMHKGSAKNMINEYKTLNVLAWNIQGMGTKLELQGVQKLLFKNDVIFLTETMKLNSFSPEIPNFSYYHCERSYKHPKARRPSGGIGVFIRSDLITTGSISVEKETEWVIWLKIRINNMVMFLGGVYIPPKGSTAHLHSVNIYHELLKDIAIYSDKSPMVSVCGDFNSRVGSMCDFDEPIVGNDPNNPVNLFSDSYVSMKWNHTERSTVDNVVNAYGKELICLCKASHLRIMNGFHAGSKSNSYTCYSSMGKSTVDYLLCSKDAHSILDNFQVCPKVAESDHAPLQFVFATRGVDLTGTCPPIVKKKTNNNPIFHYKFDKSYLPRYHEKLECNESMKHLNKLQTNIEIGCDVDSTVQHMYKYLSDSIEPVFQKKYKKRPRNTFPSNSWFDDECKTSRNALNQFSKSQDL